MKTCPFCRQQIPEKAHTCTYCRRALDRACPYCAETISVEAQVCRFCSSDLSAPPRQPMGPVGEERNLVLWIVLSILTCHIAFLVWIYQIGSDLNAHGRAARLNPALDIVLSFLTCGIWGYYVMYKYPRTLMDIAEEEGGRAPTDLAVLCLVLGIFVPIASLAILQYEMNSHWNLHRQQR